MRPIYLFIFLVFILFNACNAKEENTHENKRIILLKEINNSVQLSKLFSQIRYIPLETNSQALIGSIRKMQINDTVLYILDQESDFSNIKMFSSSGRFLGNIGETGRGANEILRPRDFFLGKEKLYIWDKRGIHSFLKDGLYDKFLFDAHFVGQSFFYTANNFYFLHELNKPGYLSQYDNTGVQKKVYIPYDFWLGSFGNSKIINLGNSKFNIFSPLMDTIFSFQNNNLVAEFYIKCDKAKTIGKIFIENKTLPPPLLSKKINKTSSSTINNYLENNTYIYISYTLKRKKYSLLINKKNWSKVYFSKYQNDIDKGTWGEAVLLTNDDELVVSLYPYDLLAFNKKNKGKIKNNKQAKYGAKIHLNDNPVLMYCKLKF